MQHWTIKPDVSVIIPCHNDDSRLPIALAAFNSQDTDLSIEVIVIDDASTTPIEPVCHQYGARYTRGSWHNANSARNHGLKISAGSIIFFFDSDNCPNSDYVRRLAEPILNNRADVTYSQRTTIGEKLTFDFDYFNKLTVRYEDLKMGPQIDTACAVKRELLSSDIWDPELVRGQDWDFHLKLLAKGARYQLIDEELWRYWFKPRTNSYQRDIGLKYLTSHAAIKRKHNLYTSGSTKLTVAAKLKPTKIIIDHLLSQVMKIQAEAKQKPNLHLIFEDADRKLFNDLLIPWLKKNRLLFNGTHVSLETSLDRDKESSLIRSIELHLESVTTENVIVLGQEDYPVSWLKKPHVVSASQLRQVHLLSSTEVRRQQLNQLGHNVDDEHAPRTIFVLYDMSSPTDIDAIASQITGYESTSKFIIFARDQASHQLIAKSELPAGCWLPAWCKNRARVLNQILNEDIEMIVVLHARAWLPSWFINSSYEKLRDDFIISGRTYWHGGSLSSSYYNIDRSSLESGPVTGQNQLPLINTHLFAINPRRVTAPLFEPRFADNWPAMILDTSFRLARQKLAPTYHSDWAVAYPVQQSELPWPSPRQVAECLSLNIPWHHAIRWCNSGSWPGINGVIGTRSERYGGLLNDWRQRWRNPEKRRMWRPL